MGGVSGVIFSPMARTYALAIGGAIGLSRTLAPALATQLLRASDEEREGLVMRGMSRAYHPLVAFGARFPLVTVVVVADLAQRQRTGAGAPGNQRAEAGHQQRAQGVQRMHGARRQSFGEEVDLHVAVVQVAPGEERRRGEGRAQLQHLHVTRHRRADELAPGDGDDGHHHQRHEHQRTGHGRCLAGGAQRAATGAQRGGRLVRGAELAHAAVPPASSTTRAPMMSLSTSLAPS